MKENKTVDRLFVGGIAHGQTRSLRHDLTQLQIAVRQLPSLIAPIDEYVPIKSDCYTRRRYTDEKGRQFEAMVLQSLSDDTIIEYLNTNTPLTHWFL
jgi:hypothetical protein